MDAAPHPRPLRHRLRRGPAPAPGPRPARAGAGAGDRPAPPAPVRDGCSTSAARRGCTPSGCSTTATPCTSSTCCPATWRGPTTRLGGHERFTASVGDARALPVPRRVGRRRPPARSALPPDRPRRPAGGLAGGAARRRARRGGGRDGDQPVRVPLRRARAVLPVRPRVPGDRRAGPGDRRAREPHRGPALVHDRLLPPTGGARRRRRPRPGSSCGRRSASRDWPTGSSPWRPAFDDGDARRDVVLDAARADRGGTQPAGSQLAPAHGGGPARVSKIFVHPLPNGFVALPPLVALPDRRRQSDRGRIASPVMREHPCPGPVRSSSHCRSRR